MLEEIEYNGKRYAGSGSEFYTMMKGVVGSSLYRKRLSLEEIKQKSSLIKEFDEKWRVAKISEIKSKIYSLNNELKNLENKFIAVSHRN